MRRLLFSTSAQSRQPLLADPIEQWRIPGQSGPERALVRPSVRFRPCSNLFDLYQRSFEF